jgi:alpha-1,6-mannosyltransferase
MRTSHGIWASGVTIGAAFLTFGLIRPDDGSVSFFVLLALAAGGYLTTLHQVANGLRPSRRTLVACAALALAWRIPMVLSPAEPAADVRRYVWDAHLIRAGLSPYLVVPADPASAHLRTAETWPLNNPDVPSPYPPGAQLFFLAATTLSESVRAIKVAAFICDALLAFVVWRSLLAAGANPGWVLAYLWSPLVTLEVSRHGHLDVAGALVLAFAAFALARGRALVGTLAFSLAVAVKPLPIVLLPLLWRRISPRHLVAGFTLLVALYLPFWDRRRLPLGSVPEVIDRFRFNGPIFSGVASLAGPAVATGLAVAAGLAVAVWARRSLPLESPRAWAWPMGAALVCAPMVYPWYLVWLAPFLVGLETMPLTIWTVSILSTYVVWRLVGVPWVVPVWALLIEYGVLAAALWQCRRNTCLRGSELESSSRPSMRG